MSRIVEGSILTVLFFLVVNVVFLNVYFISQRSYTPAASVSAETNSPDIVCDDSCQQLISDTVLSKITPNVIPTKMEKKVNTKHEFIIPLGSGMTSSKEYEVIAGVEAEIDTSLYPSIAEVIFETYMAIPTANGVAYAKLFNVTDKHDVWFSEQSMETNVTTRKSSRIKLDQGKKLYRLMMKSTMGYESKLVNARIRIITE